MPIDERSPVTRRHRVTVIGGGIVGASVLYHLARRGLTDAVLVERDVLTAGSTWHAAAGFHAVNDDPRVSALQGSTVELYRQVEAESGVPVGLKVTGGITIAGTPQRWEGLRAARSIHDSLGIEASLLTPDEIHDLCPLVDVTNVVGGLYDPHEGCADPHGITHAFVTAARGRGAASMLHTRVTGMRRTPSGDWLVETDQGEIECEHVVNAAGLWARRVSRMVGVDLPLVPMQHHYLLTEDIDLLTSRDGMMPAVVDLEGFSYLQQEHHGLILGVYETNPRHWHVDGAPWDFGMELIPPEVDRIAPELGVAFSRYPSLADVGIRRWVNGALTVTPDGNPLVGPLPGRAGQWVANGCMAGFSQAGAIGSTLADWIVDGEPSTDVLGLDVARFGEYANDDAYLCAMTGQFYARRFVMTYPNEELPAARPLVTSPSHDEYVDRHARFTCIWGLETPAYFAPGEAFVEDLTHRRSNAHACVAAEVKAVRTAAGMLDTSMYARYEVSGTGAEAWLDHLLAGTTPRTGRMRLSPALDQRGRLVGDFSVARLADDRFWIVGSYPMQRIHLRWFADRAPASGVELTNISDEWMGFAVSGPRSRAIIERLVDDDVSDAGLSFFGCRPTTVAGIDAVIARVSFTGELGFEITVPRARHRELFVHLQRVGQGDGLALCGLRASESLRLEKSYGVWSAEFTPTSTPVSCGLDRFVDLGKPEFVGRDAVLAERDNPPRQRLVTLAVDAADADAIGFEPVWCGTRRVGVVTSGAYGHTVGRSLAMAYVDADAIDGGEPMSVDVVGDRCPAELLDRPAYDPTGARLRSTAPGQGG